MRSQSIKASLGLRANRPLADNTMSRVAKGVMRYVVNAARPFIVPVTHKGDLRANSIDEPLRTITTARRGEHALITPFVTKFNTGSVGSSLDEPLATVTSHASETHGGGAAPLGLVAPHLMTMRNADKPFSGLDEPTHTIMAEGAGLAVVAPFLTPRYLEKPADGARLRSVDEPVATIIAGDNVPGYLVTPFLVPRYGERPGQEPRTRAVDEPAPVIVPTGNEGSVAAVHLSREFGASIGSPADEPAGTVTVGGASKTALVAAFLVQHNTDRGASIKAGRAVALRSTSPYSPQRNSR